MKLVDIAEFYSDQGGGVKTYIRYKLRYAAELGVSLHVIAPGAESRVESLEGGRIIWVRAPRHPADHRYHMFTRSRPVFEILDALRPHVIEGSSPWGGGWFAGRWPGRALRSLFIHSDPVASYAHTVAGRHIGYDRMDRLLFWFWCYLRRLDKLFHLSVVSSPWLATRLARFDLKKPIALGFGINKGEFAPRFRCPVTRQSMLRQCGLDERSTLLVTVSRHHPEKRIPTMIRAVGELNRTNGAEPYLGLYVIGDGLARRRIEREASGFKGIHIAGQVNDRRALARQLASADIMVHGCGSETFGLVIAEGLASGLPLVVPNRGGAADLARPGFAETYEPGDVFDCKRAMTAMLGRDRHELSRSALEFSAHGVRNISEHFEELFRTYEARLSQTALKPAPSTP